jgi:N-acetylgalactosamine kinase
VTSEDRRARLIAAFAARFDQPPGFVVRAPGRVNLIGEHTDYNGLPVMPMAIDRDVLIAGRRRPDAVVHLDNRGPFGERRFELDDSIPPFSAGDWGNYAKAAAQGLRRHLGPTLAHGADLLVDGNVPDAAGLSSSAALVVANALALLAANGIDVPFPELAELLPRAEHYVGTLGGGMDQTISLLGRAGHALRIDFRPLRHRPVPLPAGHVFAVAHSLVRADKSGGARRAYNQRVAECRLAAWALGRRLAPERSREITLLGDLPRVLERPPGDLVREADLLPPGALSMDAIASTFGTTVPALRAAVDVPADIDDSFVLRARARHVFAEADRVDAAESALLRGDVAAFGRLMDASHTSCRDDYEISCDALEDLVHAARAAGAIGARLTGAGFGGCIVALVDAARGATLLDGLDASFYGPRGVANEERPGLRFLLEPADGARIWLC